MNHSDNNAPVRFILSSLINIQPILKCNPAILDLFLSLIFPENTKKQGDKESFISFINCK